MTGLSEALQFPVKGFLLNEPFRRAVTLSVLI
uniref:Uncharacterized protein n=1 Tax=Anguilla anguilla TaxID=7936 RepID=A0A0E9VYN1_ANGAN